MVLPRLSVALVPLLLLIVGCSGGSSSVTTSSSPSAPDSIVARYADTTLTLSDFEQAYRNANPEASPASDSLSAYESFLQQYINYRLKVQAAKDARMDTLPSVRQDIRSYRKELARPQIMKKEIYEPLIKTLYERRQTEVDVSHILKRVSPDAAPEDTLDAYRELQRIADSLEQGYSFAKLALRNSEDPSAQKKGQQGFRGRLGYLRAGDLVEPFEERMYSVPVDSVSDIFRTRFGYHLLKVHDRRPAQPPIRLSHIMLRPDSNEAQARQTLDSLRTEILRDSVDFARAARTYSEDRRSAEKGGDLGRIESTRSLPPAFRNAVSEMDSVGAVSEVTKTKYGYHLIKLTDREERPSYDEAYDNLKETISGRPRVERKKDAFAREIQSEVGVAVDTSALLSATSVSTLDTLSRPLLAVMDADSSSQARDASIATMGDSTYTLHQLARHVSQTDGGARMNIGEVLESFLNAKALTYAQARLERRDPSFAGKMTEYREGLLAFQFMEDSVWTVAAQDTSALRTTFRQHRDRYTLPERIRAIVLRAPADSLLRPYAEAASPRRPPQQAAADSLVSLDTVMVTDRSAKVYRRVQDREEGAVVGPIEHEGQPLLLIRDTTLAPRRKRFEEARSSVVQDYQEQYEDTVMDRLRQRYDATLFPDRLQQAFDAAPQSSSR